MAWRSLLSGTLKDQARKAVDEISADLEALTASLPASLAAGHAGVALFFGHLARSEGGGRPRQLMDRHLDKAVELTVSAEQSSLSFFTGLSGIGWALHHLAETTPGNSSPELTADLDAAITSSLSRPDWRFQLDLVYGLVGIGCYFLDHPDRDTARRALELCCHILADKGEDDGAGGTFWRTPPQFGSKTRVPRHARGDADLGVAHGVPGMIGFLGRAAGEYGIAGAREMRDRALLWLRTQVVGREDGGAVPFFSGDAEAARSGWCYGNPGVAAALFTSCAITADREGQELALALAIRESRRSYDATGVCDATLCHGAAGLAHIYNRLYQESGLEELAECARQWFRRTLEMRGTGGLGGFLNWWPETQEWHADAGVLVGSAGIGLALLAAVSDAPPTWDRILLASGRR